MWILPALFSAFCLGFYDVMKKHSLKENAVISVLLINTFICSVLLLPFIILSIYGYIDNSSFYYVPQCDVSIHLKIVLKAIIVLSSWICGYYAIKHLPLTIVGPVNASRPVLTILGALLIFQESLNLWQWGGVIIALISFYLLSLSGKKEGIDFKNNRWILLLIVAAVIGAISGLYDKYLISVVGLSKFFVQGWYNIYQFVIMCVIWLLIGFKKERAKFQWKWTIPLISIFLTMADVAYLYSLSIGGSLIAVVSMIRRSSVVVSFSLGAILFNEKNLKSKALDLVLVFISLILLCIGSFIK